MEKLCLLRNIYRSIRDFEAEFQHKYDVCLNEGKSLLSKFLLTTLLFLSFVSTIKGQVADSLLLKELASKETTIIIDVRTVQEFEKGHIANSLNIPLDVVCDSLSTFRKYKNIILVCRSGGRSNKALIILKDEDGLGNLYNGGGWQSLEGILATKKE